MRAGATSCIAAALCAIKRRHVPNHAILIIRVPIEDRCVRVLNGEFESAIVRLWHLSGASEFVVEVPGMPQN
jgi:hypothetical protein